MLVTPSTILRARDAFPSPRSIGEIIVLLPFLMMELVPPLSLFLVQVLEAYASTWCT